MTLKGKGFMIWQIPSCDGGDADAIAEGAAQANLTHIHIKVANGIFPYNIDKETKTDLVPPVVHALKNKGIEVWGWHYVFGDFPEKEADIAILRVRQLGLDGYVIDAEHEYKHPGMDKKALTYMNRLRAGIPGTPVALCSYRYPTLHRELPWKEFLDQCEYNMPQVYWEQAHNAGSQLRRCVSEFADVAPFRPIIPVGPVYKAGGWVPQANEITEFLVTARNLGLSAANFFAWDWGRTILKPLWTAVERFPWPTTAPTPKDMPEIFIETLNTHDIQLLSSLYTQDGVHITSDKTAQGPDAIGAWFQALFTDILPDATFRLTSSSGSGNVRQFRWEADSTLGRVRNGSDTIGIHLGRIAYQYSHFTIEN